jgi:hypothetical protein
MQQTKICTKCKEEKSLLNNFGKSGKHVQSWCKKCMKDLNDSRKEYKSKWYLENKERLSKEKKEKYRATHSVEVIKEGYKKCCKCDQIKPATSEYFGKLSKSKDGFKYSCKTCRTEEYMKNQEYNILRSQKNYKGNSELIAIRNKAYKERRREWYKECDRKYYQSNKETIKENAKKNHYARLERDVGYKLLSRYRKRLWDALSGRCKPKKTQELIGCTIEELKIHLQKKFKDDMSWDNYGKWHLDHIKPCALFDFDNKEDIFKCFHYSNLQPLWAKDNLKKSAKYEKTSI